MTDAEVEAELWSRGIDPKAAEAYVSGIINRALARHRSRQK